MEELAKALDDLNERTGTEGRLSQYKARTEPKGQHDRRIALLQEHKKLRQDAFDRLRGISEEQHEHTERPGQYHVKKFRDVLMLSEWLEDIPDELEDDWTAVICPKGKRCLVVAASNTTCAYSRNGGFLASHPSFLPNGAHMKGVGKCSRMTLLDCIYSETFETYFVLDLLMWNGHSVVECDTEFRFSWLRSNLQERPGLDLRGRRNPYAFIPVPSFQYSVEALGENVAAHEKKWGHAEVDGVLFYHRKIPYIAGPTPLVGWLQPFMLPERLGIPVPATLMACKPDSYTCFTEYLKEHADDYKKKRRGARAAKSTLKSCDEVDAAMDEEAKDEEVRKSMIYH